MYLPSTIPTQLTRRLVIWIFILVLSLAAGLRFYHLGSKSLWADEVVASYVAAGPDLKANNSDLSFIYQQRYKDVSPPLRDYIAHFSFRLLGVSETALRLFPALFGILGVWLIFIVAGKWFNQPVAIIASLLLALSPFHLYHSQDGRMYTLLIFFSLGAFYCLHQAITGDGHKQRFHWIAFILLNSLNIYLSYFAFWALFSQVLIGAFWTWCHQPEIKPKAKMKRLLPLGLSLVVIMVLYLPWISAIYTFLIQNIKSPIPYLASFTTTQSTVSMEQDYIYHFSLSGKFFRELITEFGVPGWKSIIYLGLFFTGLYSMFRTHRPLFWGFIGWILIPILLLIAPPAKALFFIRYISFILPVYLLTVSVGIFYLYTWMMDKRTLSHKYPIAVVSVFFILILFLNLPADVRYYRMEKQNWRMAVQELINNVSDNDLVIAGPYNAFWCTMYYLQTNGATRSELAPASHGGEWCEVTLKDKHFYLAQKIQDKDAVDFYRKEHAHNWYISAYYRFYQYRTPDYFTLIEKNYPYYKKFTGASIQDDVYLYYQP